MKRQKTLLMIISWGVYYIVRETQGWANDELDARDAVALETTLVSNFTDDGGRAWHMWRDLNEARMTESSIEKLKGIYGDDLLVSELATLFSYEMLQVPKIDG